MDQHPIQINSLSVRELHIKTHVPVEVIEDSLEESYTISVGHSDYDHELQAIQVGLKFKAGSENPDESPYDLSVEIVGNFSVNADEFPVRKVEDWAKENAPFILMPYLREQVYSLTTRCGIEPIVIPLTVIPTKRQN